MCRNFLKRQIFSSRLFFRNITVSLQSDNLSSVLHKSAEVNMCYDVTIIGGGIVGTAIAREIAIKSKDVRCLLMEKENVLGKHQSSHNSGVIHAGIYYKPGSLKAKLCKLGVPLIYKYCDDNYIPYKSIGKLIVATDYLKLDALRILLERGLKNDVDIKMLWTKKEIMEIDSKCKGIQALWSPTTGNVNWGIVTESFGRDFRENGGDIFLNHEVDLISTSDNCDHPILIKSKQNCFIKTKYLILCGGLHSDVLANLVGKSPSANTRVISLRVNYQLLETQTMSTNIYGVPDPDLPFLGIHISPRLDGGTLLGPTAVPAYKIEGYSDEINFSYLKSTIGSLGFQNMTKKYFSVCINQVKNTVFPNFQIKELQSLAHISTKDIKQGPTAVQALRINEDGSFMDDFIFEFFKGNGVNKRIINCKFVPSPAATCSMSIAEFVADKFFREYSR